jgi:hypothetical protein
VGVGAKFMLPKRRFWKDEQKVKSGFSTDFSMVSCPNRALTPLKSASFEIRISSFVHPSKIFVWEGEKIAPFLFAIPPPPKRRVWKMERPVGSVLWGHGKRRMKNIDKNNNKQ